VRSGFRVAFMLQFFVEPITMILDEPHPKSW